MFGLGPLEIVVIGAIAVMLYGKRLPEVGRSFGRTLGELRRQWSTLQQELDVAGHIEGRPAVRPHRPGEGQSQGRYDDHGDDESGVPTVASPRFDPPSDA